MLKLKLFPLQILLIQSLEKTNSQTSETHLPSKRCSIFRNASCSSSKMMMKTTSGLADILGSGNKKTPFGPRLHFIVLDSHKTHCSQLSQQTHTPHRPRLRLLRAGELSAFKRNSESIASQRDRPSHAAHDRGDRPCGEPPGRVC